VKEQLQGRVLFGIVPIGFAFAGIAGLGVTGLAHLAGVVVYTIWLLIQGRARELLVACSNVPLLKSGLIYAVSSALGITAMSIVPPPTFSMFIQLIALTGLLIAPLFSQKPNRLDWLALPVGVVGAVLVVDGSIEHVSILGWVLMTAYLFTAAYSIQYFARMARTEEVSAAAAIVVTTAPGILFLLAQPSIFSAPTASLLAISAAGILTATGNYLLFKSALKAPAHRFMLLGGVSVVIATVGSILLLGSPWNVTLLVGGGLMFSVILLIFLAERRSKTSHK